MVHPRIAARVWARQLGRPIPDDDPGVRSGNSTHIHAWEAEVAIWLAPFLEGLGDPRRKPWLPIYVRGLLSPSERKSLTPLATHLATHDRAAARMHCHALQQFITYSAWDVAPTLRLLAQRADALLGGPDALRQPQSKMTLARAELLRVAPWRRVCWRAGTKGAL